MSTCQSGKRRCSQPAVATQPGAVNVEMAIPPDEAFASILDSSLRICIDQLGDYLSDHLAGTTAEVEFAWLDGTRIWELYDPNQLLGELQNLLTAHRSANALSAGTQAPPSGTRTPGGRCRARIRAKLLQARRILPLWRSASGVSNRPERSSRPASW